MKSLIRGAALVGAVLFAPALWAENLSAVRNMTDPLLGISFDPALVGFELFKGGDAVRKAIGERSRWVFASARDKDAVVYIVSGVHPGRVEDGGAALEPDFGTVLRVRGDRVEVLGAPDYLFSSAPALSAEVVDELVKDAAARYARAFDGAAKVNRAIRAQSVTLNEYPAVVVRRMGEAGIQVQSASRHASLEPRGPK